MNRIYKTLGILLMLTSLEASAQKRKDYYPNGKVAFEGKYSYGWSEFESFELPYSYQESESYSSRGGRRRSDIEEIDQYMNIMPQKRYDGTCKFYFPDGNISYTGSYKQGIKDGKFTIYYPTGKIKSIRYYDRGMATGTWEYWDEYGNKTAVYAYRAIPDALLSTIDRDVLMQVAVNNRYSDRKENRFQQKQVDSTLKSFFRPEKAISYKSSPLLDDHQRRLSQFNDYIEENLFHRTFKHGVFKVWSQKQERMEFAFEDNLPSGTWKLWENGKLAFEMSFEQHKVVAAKDYINPDHNYSEEKYRQRRYDDSLRNATGYRGYSDDPNAIDPGLAVVGPPPSSGRGVIEAPPGIGKPGNKETFVSVEQMPEFPGGTAAMSKYLSDNIRYPKEALAARQEGKVFLKFVVTELGDITEVSIVRSSGSPLLDKEALRVVKSMPKWRSGKQNGRSVRVYYTLPVHFNLQ